MKKLTVVHSSCKRKGCYFTELPYAKRKDKKKSKPKYRMVNGMAA